eukprot:1634452-Pyramimonas_sp.AAC.1
MLEVEAAVKHILANQGKFQTSGVISQQSQLRDLKSEVRQLSRVVAAIAGSPGDPGEGVLGG